MINLLIADDHAVVRHGVKLILESNSTFNIVGEASSGKQVLHLLLDGVMPDIIITDYLMPDMDGIELTKILRDKYPSVKVIFLSMVEERNIVAEAFRYGAVGFLLKDVKPLELNFAVEHVFHNEHYISSAITVDLLERSLLLAIPVSVPNKEFNLNSREAEILELISEGLSNKEISDRLYISKRTVEGHRMSLMSKIGSKNTASLVKSAMRSGLLS
ncbi:MAG: response regulator transcription factor [Pedobacter sp.]|uniref:response regulator n=1 Tax=Pedobacter sp. TaxID=1411316 RepID=UPI00339B757B